MEQDINLEVKMKIKLSKKLLIAFLVLSFGVIFTSGIISNIIIEKGFNKYLKETNDNNIKRLIIIIEESYPNLDRDEMLNLALLEKFSIEIKDMSGRVVFKTGNQHLLENKYNMPMMKGKEFGRQSFNTEDYLEEKFDIVDNGVAIGSVTVGYFGIYNFNEKDIIFRRALNQSFLMSIGIGVLIAIILSLIISKQLTKPLGIINKNSAEIRKGNFKIREDVKTNTIEIKELSDSINYLADSLEKQDSLRKRLTSDMAHEIRTPLTTLQNSMEAMLDGVIEMDSNRIESCYEEVLRINKLVDNLKNIASIEESNLNLNRTYFNVLEELDKISNGFGPYFKNKNINFIKEFEEVGEALLDKDKFRQIINNLLSNAYRYSEEQGEIRLILNINDKKINIDVIDKGIGISEEELPLIFERFYRSDRSRNRETGGAGIGLTITKALVEAHGGEIIVESKENYGSKFKVILPLV